MTRSAPDDPQRGCRDCGPEGGSAASRRGGPEPKQSDIAYWDSVAAREGARLPPLLAAQKRRTHLALLSRWGGDLAQKRILKTDLFEEAFGSDAFLADLARPRNELFAFDLSAGIVARASRRLTETGARLVAADVRHLPYRDASFDLIISNSTLDHFDSRDAIRAALAEFARILRDNGLLIVTMDNPRNIFHPLLRFAERLRLTPFRLGITCSVRDLAAYLGDSGLEVTDTCAILHNPRLTAYAAASVADRLGWSPLNRCLERLLASAQRLEGTRIQYWTGSFVAARARRPGGEP